MPEKWLEIGKIPVLVATIRDVSLTYTIQNSFIAQNTGVNTRINSANNFGPGQSCFRANVEP